jgi:LysM domain
MTVPVDAEERGSESRPVVPGSGPAPEPNPRPRPLPNARDAVDGLCPYLASTGGSWRVAVPSRDHRCSAVEPAAPQTTDKQRRHCLSPDHVDCPLFRAARSARAAALLAGSDAAVVERADRRRRPLARTAPILMEPPRLVDQAVRLRLDQAPGQAALIGLMIVAFAVIALARLAGGGASVASASASPSALAALPSATPRPTPRPSPSVEASAAPSVSPSPSFRATYTVKKGDTLLAIAKRFSTSAAKIRAANGMSNSNLKVGQVLNIP